MTTNKGGRPVVFQGKVKNRAHRYQGIVTPEGRAALEAARVRLARLAKRDASTISDSDLFEFLARGATAARESLRRQRS